MKEREKPKISEASAKKRKFNNKIDTIVLNKIENTIGRQFGLIENLEICNDLYWIQTGSQNFIVHKIESINEGPSARYLHTMNYNEKGQYLIVVGGRNNESTNFVLNDIWLYNLMNNNWFLSYTRDKIASERFGHTVVDFNDTLIIFGGMNIKSYCSNKVH